MRANGIIVYSEESANRKLFDDNLRLGVAAYLVIFLL